MSLWCDKHRPTSLSKLDYNKRQAEDIKQMLTNDDFPHLMVFGNPGAGKKTRIQCILRELYGSGVDKLRLENQTYTTPSNTKVEIRTVCSNYHIEVNPCDVNNQDRLIIQELIKSTASSGAIAKGFKVIVITEADRLTKDAQHALRRTMEKYIQQCRIILTSNSSSRIIPAIKSRCLLVRVAAPTADEISSILLQIARKENYNPPKETINRIIELCDRNLRRAIMMLEASKLHSGDVKRVRLPPWQSFIQTMARSMIDYPSMENLQQARDDFYELQAHLIPPETIFEVIVCELLNKLDEPKLKARLIELAAFYEHKMRLGSKQIYHFEAFAANLLHAIRHFNEKHTLPDTNFY